MSSKFETLDDSSQRRVLLSFSLVSAPLYLAAAVFQWAQARPLMALSNAATAIVLVLTCALLHRQPMTRTSALLCIWSAVANAGLLALVTGASSIAALAQVPVIGLSASYLLGESDFRRVFVALTGIVLFSLIWPALGQPSPEHVPPGETVRFLQVLQPAMLLLTWLTTSTYRRASASLIASLVLEKKFKQQEAESAEHFRRQAKDLIRIASDGFWETDADGKLTLISAPITSRLGIREADLLGLTPWDIYRRLMPDADPIEAHIAHEIMRRHIPLKSQRLHLRDRDGRGHLLIVSGQPWRLTDGRFGGYRGILRDETESERRHNATKRLSETDPLTGLANRRRFDTVFADEWSRGYRSRQPLAIVMLDIDYFKLYNDHYGHQAGDECLRAVAQVLQTSARRAGDLVARYGGEEFVVVAADADVSTARELAETMRRSVERLAMPHEVSDAARVVTVSLGIAVVVPSEHTQAARLLHLADDALYRAKKDGRNRVGS